MEYKARNVFWLEEGGEGEEVISIYVNICNIEFIFKFLNELKASVAVTPFILHNNICIIFIE